MNPPDRLSLSTLNPVRATSVTSTRKLLLMAALVSAPVLWTDPVLAQTADERPQQTPLERVEEPLAEAGVEDEPDYGSALSLSAGSTFTTEYWFRGVLQENQGLIAQPYMELGIGLYAPEDESYSLDATVGIWNSFHSEKTGAAATGPESWYESDLYGGATFTTGNFELGAVYTFYTSPSGAFETIEEIGLFTGYEWDLAGDADRDDDVDVALGAGGGIYYETADEVGAEDAYGELNITPGVEFNVSDGMPLSLSFPVVVGLSVDDYYFDDAGDNELFGYVSVGAEAGVPLPVPARYGEWALTGAVTGVFLNAESLETVPGADSSNLFGSLTVGVSF